MTTQPPTTPSGFNTTALIDRVKNILMAPRAEWDKIAAEPFDLAKTYTNYLAPLAGISAIATAIGLMMFPIGAFGYYVHISPTSAIAQGVIQFVMAFVSAYVLGLVINALAPTFGSTQSPDQANKLAIYSATAGLVAGVLNIMPALSILVLIGGIYSLVLLYLGLPRLMKTPEDKRIGYFATIIIVLIVIFVVIGMIMQSLRTSF